MIAVMELEAERSESGCSVTCQQIWLQLSGSITDQPVWHMTSEVTTRRRKPFGFMSGGLSFSWSFSSNAVYQKSKVFVEKQAPAGKGAANVPHEGLRNYFGELYKVWPYELRWDMFSIFRSGLCVCVFETLPLLKNLGYYRSSLTNSTARYLFAWSWSSNVTRDCMGLGHCSEQLCLWAKISKIGATLVLASSKLLAPRWTFALHSALAHLWQWMSFSLIMVPNHQNPTMSIALRFQVILMIYNLIRCYSHGICDCLGWYMGGWIALRTSTNDTSAAEVQMYAWHLTSRNWNHCARWTLASFQPPKNIKHHFLHSTCHLYLSLHHVVKLETVDTVTHWASNIWVDIDFLAGSRSLPISWTPKKHVAGSCSGSYFISVCRRSLQTLIIPNWF